jgi:phosphatidylglycerol:prolipoprotein diacylglycerol transferase
MPLHPTQLYEAGAEFMNFLLVVALGRKNRTPGRLAGTYLVLYGIERCIIEFFRGNPGRTSMLGGIITLMQFVSICLVVLGLMLLFGVRASSAAS